ncbi:MAG TPA: hypothetical protein PKC43_10465 [Phycisphaerales bacterium]|nr:hypothetical protein [Phycisphaerales bacterium]HMP37858.1 hypothetical protein [Phycisphaerales bacterium]
MLGLLALASALTFTGCGDGRESGPLATSPASLGPADTYADVDRALGSSVHGAVEGGTISDAALVANAALLDRVVEASKATTCDFGVDYSAGLTTELPHLAAQRRLARALQADAARLLSAGDKDGAAKRIAAIYRMAGQVGGSGQTAIEFMAALGMAHLATEFIQQNRSLADAAWRTDILQAMSEFRQRSLARAPEILEADGKLVGSWLRHAQDTSYATVATQGLKRRTSEQRIAAAAAIESIAAEAAGAWPGASPARMRQLNEKAKSRGVEDLSVNHEAMKHASDQTEAALRSARTALGGS